MNKRYCIKIVLFFITYALLSIISFSQSGFSFHLRGKLQSSRIKAITLIYRDADGQLVEKKDSISDGAFIFSGFIKEPTSASLSCDITTSGNSSDSNYIGTFFIEPVKMTMDIKEGSFGIFRLAGSKTQTDYDALEEKKAPVYAQKAPLLAQLDKLNDTLGMALKMRDSIKISEVMRKRKQLFLKLKPYNNAIAEIDFGFVALHPDSYLSAYLLFHKLESQYLDTTKYYFSKLSPVVRNSYYGKSISDRLGIKQALPIGSVFPDIRGRSITGSEIYINNSLTQPYTLLIFWASWCGPCRKHIPEYRRIYAQYQSKGLQIIAITSDADKKDWLYAIKKDSIQKWQHFFPDNAYKIWDLCGVATIPAEILLNNNKVIAKFEGADYGHAGLEALAAKLQQLFEAEKNN